MTDVFPEMLAEERGRADVYKELAVKNMGRLRRA